MRFAKFLLNFLFSISRTKAKCFLCQKCLPLTFWSLYFAICLSLVFCAIAIVCVWEGIEKVKLWPIIVYPLGSCVSCFVSTGIIILTQSLNSGSLKATAYRETKSSTWGCSSVAFIIWFPLSPIKVRTLVRSITNGPCRRKSLQWYLRALRLVFFFLMQVVFCVRKEGVRKGIGLFCCGEWEYFAWSGNFQNLQLTNLA